MTGAPSAVDMAAIHAAAFETPRPWSEAEFHDLIAAPGSVIIGERDGFALGRVIAGEAELLTIAVLPDARRRGLGGRILAGFIDAARSRGAASIWLEVAADNPTALALYRRVGFVQTGRRRGYYRAPDGTAVDAVVMTCEAPAAPPAEV